ncbi:MAG: hypothetical protein ABL962_07025 [Fimbriimonadaceae bacterium]
MTNQFEKSQANQLLDECRELAESRSILSVLDQDLKKCGFAGPTIIPQTILLATYTRIFPQPVSVVVKGPSSSGKSFALKAALRYVPDEVCEVFHGLSEKALVYANKLNLQHRYLVIQEAAGFAEGNGRTFLRQLLSEGQVRYMTVQNTKDGNVGQELPVIKGPIGLLMTTTANKLHWEDETRMLAMQMDRSPEQISRALLANVKNGPKVPSEAELSRWHALHRYVTSSNLSVVVPFETALLSSLPTSHQRVLRDAPQVLSLIRAHALMHQCTRNQDQNGAVIASIDDYATVYELVSDALAQSLDKSVAPHIREIVDAVVRASEGQPVSITELAGILDKDAGVVSRNVSSAVSLGYLENQNPGQGHKAMLVPGGRELPKGTVLPAPKELMEYWERGQESEAQASFERHYELFELPS